MSRWSGSVVRVASFLGVALAVAAGLSACSADEVEPTSADRRSTPSNSPAPESEETHAGRSCKKAQLEAMRGLAGPDVVWLITSDVDGASAKASSMVQHGLDRGEDKLREPCGGLPEEMAGVKRTVLATTAVPLDAAGLERLEQAIGGWARTLGERAPLNAAAAWVRHCRDLGTQLSAGYTVGWEYTGRGRRWWVQMTIDSDLSTRVWVDIGGTLWATGLPRDPYSRNDGRGGQQVEWGGSSADSLYAQPFTSSTKQAGLPGPAGYLHTSADGRVYGVRPEVFVRHGGPACSLPVPRLG
jgi:hypothetical protein